MSPKPRCKLLHIRKSRETAEIDDSDIDPSSETASDTSFVVDDDDDDDDDDDVRESSFKMTARVYASLSQPIDATEGPNLRGHRESARQNGSIRRVGIRSKTRPS